MKETKGDHLAYIDALRGCAILGVVVVHTSQPFELPWPARLLADQGARGVQLFFVVSALTLVGSWHRRADGVLTFWIRRAFRILPMLWLALTCYVLTAQSMPPLRDIIAVGTLTHGLRPETIDAIVPGCWSVADEAIFYAILPLLIWTLRSLRSTLVAIALSFLCSATMALAAKEGWLFPHLEHGTVVLFAFLSFPNHLPAFLVGMFVFRLVHEVHTTKSRPGLAIMVAAAIALATPFASSQFVQLSFFLPAIYSIPFGLAAWGLAHGDPMRLINPVMRYIGKISYSMYFWHFPIVTFAASFSHSFLLAFVTVLAVTIVGSTATFYLVEAPMIRLGRRLAAHHTVSCDHAPESATSASTGISHPI